MSGPILRTASAMKPVDSVPRPGSKPVPSAGKLAGALTIRPNREFQKGSILPSPFFIRERRFKESGLTDSNS